VIENDLRGDVKSIIGILRGADGGNVYGALNSAPFEIERGAVATDIAPNRSENRIAILALVSAANRSNMFHQPPLRIVDVAVMVLDGKGIGG
jgi:hypothetical protein